MKRNVPNRNKWGTTIEAKGRSKSKNEVDNRRKYCRKRKGLWGKPRQLLQQLVADMTLLLHSVAVSEGPLCGSATDNIFFHDLKDRKEKVSASVQNTEGH